MNFKLDKIRFVAPAVVGGCMVALSIQGLKEKEQFAYEPNPGALARSPYGRLVGMALQGPITRFWDYGICEVEGEVELIECERPDEKLFNWVVGLDEAKTTGRAPEDLRDVYQDYSMARIEKKLDLAWKMDPRNFANYAIYQMFLWEGFNKELIDSEMNVRELSLETLEICLSDEESAVSLLTAGQAAYDLVFAARTSETQQKSESFEDVDTYSKLLSEIISDYDVLVATMVEDGRWDEFSEIKRAEFDARRNYLQKLNHETKIVIENLTQTSEVEGGSQS